MRIPDLHTIFELVPDINISSSKHTPISSITITNVETKNNNKDVEIHLSLNSGKVIDMKNNNTF